MNCQDHLNINPKIIIVELTAVIIIALSKNPKPMKGAQLNRNTEKEKLVVNEEYEQEVQYQHRVLNTKL